MRRNLYFFLFAFLLISCKKDKVVDQNPNPTVDPNFNFSIVFSDKTIAIAGVDSVVAIFKHGTTLSKEHLQKGGNLYGLNYKNGQKLEDMVSLAVFVKEDMQSLRKYLLTEINTSSLTGPIVNKYDKWSPYIVLFDKAGGIEITIPEKPGNTAVEFNFSKPNNWNQIYLDMIIKNQTNHVLDGDSWEMSGACNGKISTTDGFSNYFQRIKDTKWNTSEILCLIMDLNTNEERLFYYTYPQRY